LLALHDADINGELLANVQASGTIVLRATARYFGDIRAANLVVEPGAVVVGNVRLGAAAAPEAPKEKPVAMPAMPKEKRPARKSG